MDLNIIIQIFVIGMRRIFALFLLAVLLPGQFNLTWATHFCGKMKVIDSVTIGKDELSCGMEDVSCCSEETSTSNIPKFKSEECCSNDYYSAESDEFFSIMDNSLDKQVIFAATFIVSLFDLTPKSNEVDTYAFSSPPLIQSDIQVLYQSFLL